MINWDLAHDHCPTESGWKAEAQRVRDQSALLLQTILLVRWFC